MVATVARVSVSEIVPFQPRYDLTAWQGRLEGAHTMVIAPLLERYWREWDSKARQVWRVVY
jgi:hypothetical protein